MDLTEIRDIVMMKTHNYNVDETDDAIRLVQRTYIQPIARLNKTATYTTDGSDSININKVANDIYKINQVVDGKNTIPLVNVDEVDRYGIRRDGNTLHFQGISSGRELRFHYQAQLNELNADHTVPDIDEDWHDLYWLGAAAIIKPDMFPLFQDRLTYFKNQMVRKDRPRGTRARVGPWR